MFCGLGLRNAAMHCSKNPRVACAALSPSLEFGIPGGLFVTGSRFLALLNWVN